MQGGAQAEAAQSPLAGFGSSLGALLLRLRVRLRLLISVVAACWIVTFVFAQELIVLLARPLIGAWENHKDNLAAPSLHFKSLVEPFWTYMTLAFWIGIFVAMPFLLYQVWNALTRVRPSQQQAHALPFALTAFALMCGGVAFCYFVVLPLAFDFFLGYADQNLAQMSTALGIDYQLGQPLALKPALYMQQYLTLTIRLLVAFGLVFELPVIIFFLASIGLVTHRGLWKFNRWAVVLAFVIAAFLTPGPDVISQVAMALPLLILYNASIGVAYLIHRRRPK